MPNVKKSCLCSSDENIAHKRMEFDWDRKMCGMGWNFDSISSYWMGLGLKIIIFSITTLHRSYSTLITDMYYNYFS